MWKSFDDLASRVDRLEKPIMPLSDKSLAHKIHEMYQKELEYKLKPHVSFEQFTPKKEEKVSNNVDLILTAEGLTKFIKDLQSMQDGTKPFRDSRGNRVIDEVTGEYKMIEIPLADRWVSVGNVRVNDEGKFVVRVEPYTLDSLEAYNSKQTRIASYQAIA